MASADEARRLERLRGTAQGGDYEEDVAQLLAEMGQSSGDLVHHTAAETGTLGHSKVGDHVVEIHTASGSLVRVVFESKKRKRITLQNIRDELDTAATNRDARAALMVLSSEDSAPNRLPFQRIGVGRYIVVYDEGNRDALALRVAYQQARADALTLYGLERGGDTPSIDLEALSARLAEARTLLENTSRIGAGIRKAQSSLDSTLRLGEKMRNDIMETLDKIHALISTSEAP